MAYTISHDSCSPLRRATQNLEQTGTIHQTKMTEQKLTSAYRLLGVDSDASDEAIASQYRHLAYQAHPDQGGTDDEMAQLAEAYALVRSARGSGDGALALRRTGVAVASPQDMTLRRDELRNDSRRAFETTIRHRTSRLKQAKRQGVWAAIGSAGIAVIIAFMRTLGLDSVQDFEGNEEVWLTSTMRLTLVIACLVVSAVLGLLAWRAAARSTWIEAALEDFSDTLSDKNSFLQLIQLLTTEAGLPERWTRGDIIDCVTDWIGDGDRRRALYQRGLVTDAIRALLFPRALHDEVPLRDLARVAGPVDTGNLIITKGLERELIEEQLAGDGSHGYAYRLTV